MPQNDKNKSFTKIKVILAFIGFSIIVVTGKMSFNYDNSLFTSYELLYISIIGIILILPLVYSWLKSISNSK